MRSFTSRLETWNRRLHFYLGLYFLFFLWLFSLTGLMLNHGQWAVSRAANNRRETRYERVINAPAGSSDLARARNVIAQLGLTGEIDLPVQRPGSFTFSTSRPSDANQVRVDLATNRAAVQHFDNGHVGRFRILHTFSGSRFNQPASERDWFVTTIWVAAMDALAVGLLAMILGSYYMWWRLKKRHLPGVMALLAGFLACGWFVSGLF
jgi:hypothetical protein